MGPLHSGLPAVIAHGVSVWGYDICVVGVESPGHGCHGGGGRWVEGKVGGGGGGLRIVKIFIFVVGVDCGSINVLES
jgi:hypothetical protein